MRKQHVGAAPRSRRADRHRAAFASTCVSQRTDILRHPREQVDRASLDLGRKASPTASSKIAPRSRAGRC